MTSAVENLHQAFIDINAEIRQEGSEFDFRYSLVDHLFTDALGWSRTIGTGHVNFEDEQKDLLCYDDSEPPFPVIVCETKRPSHDLGLADHDQLETYMVSVGSAEYGILTNGHTFNLYEYIQDDRSIRKIVGLDVDKMATTNVEKLDADQRDALRELTLLQKDRYVDFDAADFFRTRYQEVPVQYQEGVDDEGYELFLDAVKDSLDELTEVLKRFFDDYQDREEGSYPKHFLDSTFPDWKDWRAYTGQTEDAKDAFCRETAYIVLNRALFARIAEDKEIVGHTRISSRGMAEAIERGDEQPYLSGLMDTYDRIDNHYSDLYDLGIFDWWWVSRDKRQQFSSEEERRQRTLEDELDYTLSTVLKRLNRFDFERVNRDILGHVYEDYLPKEERKELGEYYTPIEVIQYMLDTAGYEVNAGIGQQKILDPACGSGGFLTEAAERLIQHYLNKFGETSIHYLDGEQARTILERIQNNLYGIDINPFAVHITQINLLFRTIDLYNKVMDVNPHYTLDGFEIHVADTLSPTIMEKRERDGNADNIQSNLQQFAEYNGRAQSFIEDRNAVDRIKDEIEFDVVIANPPYVRIQNLSNDVKELYSKNYRTTVKNFDIYIPFIERGLNWLTEDGSLAYICPNRVVNADYGVKIRQRLGDEPITHLLDFKDTKVFDAATPYPCILVVDREAPIDDDIKCARVSETKSDLLDEIKYLEDWGASSAKEYELYTHSQSSLRADNRSESLPCWKPMPDDEREVFNSIQVASDYRLEEVTDEVFQGIITGKDKVFAGEIVQDNGDGTVEFKCADAGEPETIEKDILRRLLKGKEIERWGTNWSGLWVVFPYAVTDDGARALTKHELQNDYPHAWRFFKNHETTLKAREGGKWEDRDQWWRFSRKQNIGKFETDKIMAGVLRQRPSFVPDDEGKYYFVGGGTAGGYGIHLSEEYAPNASDTLYYGALLNSRVIEFYHKHISFIFNSKYYSFGQTFLEPLPIVAETEHKDTVVKSAREIRDMLEEVEELQYKTSEVTNYLPEYDRSSTILDIVDSVDLDDDDYRQDPIRTGESDDAFQVVMKQGHHLNFSSEEVRNFVYRLLTEQGKRLNRMEILDMPVPTKDGILALMDEYETNKQRIQDLQEESVQKQLELDDLIMHDVYGLSEEDKEIIDNYLEIW
ncbi:Eco57I restriction-modification methylase domain-containing protein [Natronosalvus caseinilyticus]|uniref:Eco57I restriction-modification methylase domain-containing protein n=1 Tax=Natronosalvus caseinilyticus TaxID=2953747 RepID=UPI0028AB17F7|nr:N-6 DNA methylase [Natronosalvus caseinilyticus]